MGRGLRTRQALALASFSILIVPLSLFIFGAVTAQADAPPRGPTCVFEADQGSGPAGTGREEIHWGWFPTKYCVGSLDWPPEEPTLIEDDIYPFGLLVGVLIYPAAVVGGLIVFVVGRAALLRLNPRTTATT